MRSGRVAGQGIEALQRIEGLSTGGGGRGEKIDTSGPEITLDQLSKREREVMELVASGMSNKAMAEALEVSVRTIEVHRASVYEKLDVQSAVELLNALNSLSPPRS